MNIFLYSFFLLKDNLFGKLGMPRPMLENVLFRPKDGLNLFFPQNTPQHRCQYKMVILLHLHPLNICILYQNRLQMFTTLVIVCSY